jgi:hypothetical protein
MLSIVRVRPRTPTTLTRICTRGALVAAMLATVASGLAPMARADVTPVPSSSAPARPSAAQVAASPFGVAGRGARVPFVESEAEDARTNGTVIGPSRDYGTLPSEASGRRAVTLHAAGQYVEFTLVKAANAIDVRYSVPDSPAGTGITVPIDLLVNGAKLASLKLSSKYSWYYGGYPFSNDPRTGSPHHFYDEKRARFATTLPAGTKIRLQASAASIVASPSLTIDLADFESVAPPRGKPAGALDMVTDFGADPTGVADATQAIQAAVRSGASRHRTVWIPPGKFLVTGHVIVDQVTVAGAGPWYSVLTGPGVGLYGKDVAAGGPSSNVTLKDFAVIGQVTERDDDAELNAIGGAMSDSTVDNLWLQHTRAGIWMAGPMTRFTVTGSRIVDQTADGVNLHTGVTRSRVSNTFIRNTGDDGLAGWAQDVPEHGNIFSHNTVVLPVLGNNIALYGGRNIRVTDNVVADTVTNGGGIHVANRYPGVNAASGTALAGTVALSRNTLIRSGSADYNWRFGIGAIWFDGLSEAITGARITVADTDVLDSSYAAIQFIEGQITGVRFTNLTIRGTGTFAIQVQARGAAAFEHLTVAGIGADRPVYSCQGGGFTLTRGSGDSGVSATTSYCGPWPAPRRGASLVGS